jgi:glutaredoxin 3
MIKIYTKNYCPYCTQAKALLTSLGAEYEEVDVTSSPEVMEDLVEKTGLMTVPQIFLGEKLLGGYDDIAKLNEEGKLADLIKEN